MGGINTSDPTLPNIDTETTVCSPAAFSSSSQSASAMCPSRSGRGWTGHKWVGGCNVRKRGKLSETREISVPKITTTHLIVRQRERERGGELGAVFCRRCRSVVKPRHSALIVTLAGNRCWPRVASSGHLSDGGIHHCVNAEYAAKYDRPH